MVKIELNLLITLIRENGISTILNALLVYIMYKTFNKINDSTTLITNHLLKEYYNDSTFKTITKMKAKNIIDSLKIKVINYVIRNNIKQNYENIKNELVSFVEISKLNIRDTFNNKTKDSNINTFCDIINDILKSNVENILLVFEDVANNTQQTPKEELLRKFEAHFSRTEADLMQLLDNVNY